MGRNPATGETIKIKASRKAKITPLKAFKDAALTGKTAASKVAKPAAKKATAKKAAPKAAAKKATKSEQFYARVNNNKGSEVFRDLFLLMNE